MTSLGKKVPTNCDPCSAACKFDVTGFLFSSNVEEHFGSLVAAGFCLTCTKLRHPVRLLIKDATLLNFLTSLRSKTVNVHQGKCLCHEASVSLSEE